MRRRGNCSSARWQSATKVLGSEHPNTAESLNNLAAQLEPKATWLRRGRYSSARCDPRKGARPRASRYGGGLNNLAHLAQAQGHLAAAKPLFERSLAIREKVLGPEHPLTATSLNNLASCCRPGDLGGARPLCERALAITEKALGPEHPQTAGSLNNLADLLRAQGDLAARGRFQERDLAICEKVLAPSIPIRRRA